MFFVYLWLADSCQIYYYFCSRFENRGFPLNSLRPGHFIGVGSCLQWIANSSSHGSFGDCVGEGNHNSTMIWKCSGIFQEVQFLESLKTECYLLCKRVCGWSKVDRWRGNIPGWGISAWWLSPGSLSIFYIWGDAVCCSWNPLEKEMTTHSSILAWRIPWTEEPGGLQSMQLPSQTQLSN